MYVIIAGVGVIGKQVTQVLVENKHDVVVIDRDPEACEAAYTETGALTIHGNATDIHILQKAGGTNADVIVCLMRQAADNIACALLARSLGIPRVVMRSRNPMYDDAYRLAGGTEIVRMADLVVNQLIMEIEQPRVKKIMTLGGGSAGIYVVLIPENARCAAMTIKDVAQKRTFPKDCLIIGIYKHEKEDFLIPRGSHTLDQGDTVFFLAKTHDIKKATDFLTKIR